MTPYYTDEKHGITIYNADCRDVLGDLPKVDLVLTDPPYGIGIAANPVRQAHARMDWDADPPDAALFGSLLRCSEYQIIWGGNYFGLPASQCFLVWDKAQPEDFSLAMCEQAWTNLQKPAKLYRMRVTGGYAKEHPTQKPVELMSWCMKHSPKTDTILDPFMGSGTTLVAAKRLGRRAIGIEIEEKYCAIAVKRLEAATLELFEQEPEQTALFEAAENAEIERCNAEIQDIKAKLRSGHPDVQGLCLALSDWSNEKRLLESAG